MYKAIKTGSTRPYELRQPFVTTPSKLLKPVHRPESYEKSPTRLFAWKYLYNNIESVSRINNRYFLEEIPAANGSAQADAAKR